MTNSAARSSCPAFARRRATLLGLLVAGAFGIGVLGCANGEIRLGDPFDRAQTLEEAQHRYTVLMRWSEFQKAKSFVPKDDRDAFLERMNELEDARFTGYESESVELDDAKQTATIKVVYTLYFPHSPYETEISEIQEWSRDGLRNEWRVRSLFEGLPALAAR